MWCESSAKTRKKVKVKETQSADKMIKSSGKSSQITPQKENCFTNHLAKFYKYHENTAVLVWYHVKTKQKSHSLLKIDLLSQVLKHSGGYESPERQVRTKQIW